MCQLVLCHQSLHGLRRLLQGLSLPVRIETGCLVQDINQAPGVRPFTSQRQGLPDLLHGLIGIASPPQDQREKRQGLHPRFDTPDELQTNPRLLGRVEVG
jgi:hypothetical protein